MRPRCTRGVCVMCIRAAGKGTLSNDSLQTRFPLREAEPPPPSLRPPEGKQLAASFRSCRNRPGALQLRAPAIGSHAAPPAASRRRRGGQRLPRPALSAEVRSPPRPRRPEPGGGRRGVGPRPARSEASRAIALPSSAAPRGAQLPRGGRARSTSGRPRRAARGSGAPCGAPWSRGEARARGRAEALAEDRAPSPELAGGWLRCSAGVERTPSTQKPRFLPELQMERWGGRVWASETDGCHWAPQVERKATGRPAKKERHGWRTVAFVVASPAASRQDGCFGTGLNKQSPCSCAELKLRRSQSPAHSPRLRAAADGEPRVLAPAVAASCPCRATASAVRRGAVLASAIPRHTGTI